jgi:hypothetical protein
VNARKRIGLHAGAGAEKHGELGGALAKELANANRRNVRLGNHRLKRSIFGGTKEYQERPFKLGLSQHGGGHVHLGKGGHIVQFLDAGKDIFRKLRGRKNCDGASEESRKERTKKMFLYFGVEKRSGVTRRAEAE